MHPIHWLFTHPVEAQVINIFVTAFLTLTLIIITFQYARTTARSVRVAEADVRARLKPIPHIELAFIPPNPAVHPQRSVIVTITTENAPLRIIGLELQFDGSGQQAKQFEGFRQNIIELAKPFNATVKIEKLPPGCIWCATLTYKDLSGLLIYRTAFDSHGFLGEDSPIDPRTLYNRVLFRVRASWLRRRSN